MFGQKCLAMGTFLFFVLSPVLALAYGLAEAPLAASTAVSGAETILLSGVVVLFIMGLMYLLFSMFPHTEEGDPHHG